MTAGQSVAILLYAASVVAGYPSQRKPAFLTPTVSAGLKALAIILVLYGFLDSILSLSFGRLTGWFGVLAVVGAMVLFEVFVDGTKLWHAHHAVQDGGTVGSTATGTDDSFDDSSFDDSGFDDSSFDNSSFDDGSFGDSSFDDSGFDDGSFDDSSFDDSGFGERTFDDTGFSVTQADGSDSIETKLGDVEESLQDLHRRTESLDQETLRDHLSDEFDDVERGSDRSIVINGDVVIDQHEEHRTTDARTLNDETTIDDSVVNRSEIDTESASFDDE